MDNPMATANTSRLEGASQRSRKALTIYIISLLSR